MTTIWRKALHWFSGKYPIRIVRAEEEGQSRNTNGARRPLFERYHVWKAPESWGYYRATFFLHHYLRSDPDPAPHDHPWLWAIAIPLAGGYWEMRPVRISREGLVHQLKWRPPFVPYRLTGNTYHRVIIDKEMVHMYGGIGSWSLFIHGPRRKTWGFLREVIDPKTAEGFVFYEETVDNSSSAALGHSWWVGGKLGHEVERAEP